MAAVLVTDGTGLSVAERPLLRWYAVRTLAHREFTAANQLGAQGFEAFLPTYWKTVRHARQFRTTRAPFFPAYLFVRIDLQRERWRSVNGTLGIASFVMSGDLPAPVPHGIVETIHSWSDGSGCIALTSGLSPGQKVRVLSGPFAERIGTLSRLDANGRVQVLLELMGGHVPVDFPRRSLSAA